MLSFSSIVLIGHFNPAIFHPQWFERFRILPLQEIQLAVGEKRQKEEIEHKGQKIILEKQPPPIFVTPQLTQLQFPSLTILVRPDRFECISVKRDTFQKVKEVTTIAFSLLPHTPISGIGINFEGHWVFDEKVDVKLKNLFSKDDEFLKKSFGKDYLIGGFVVSKENNCTITSKFETSPKIENGIFFNMNNHRDIVSNNAEDAVDFINKYYDNDLERTISIALNILGEPRTFLENEQPKDK